MGSSEKLYYSISEVCDLTGLKPHVLRYWETAFPMLTPSKNKAGNRVYDADDLEVVRAIKRLLYEERFTVEGARAKLRDMLEGEGQMDLDLDGGASVAPGELDGIVEELRELISMLERDPMDGRSDSSGRGGEG
ncbi:MAG: MerR family transcriptional regulator [Candidatus Fermentibacteraceae bacterium]